MLKYIKMDSGNLYCYKDAITIFYENNKNWVPSKLGFIAILYSDRNDYVELDEDDVANEYGKEAVDQSYECFKNINKLLKK